MARSMTRQSRVRSTNIVPCKMRVKREGLFCRCTVSYHGTNRTASSSDVAVIERIVPSIPAVMKDHSLKNRKRNRFDKISVGGSTRS